MISRKSALVLGLGAVLASAFGLWYMAGRQAAPLEAATPPNESFERILRWPLPPAERAYGAIDGDHIKQYVNEIVDLTRRNREPGAQYWGRLTGTASDAAMRQWVLEKFRQIGLQDVREDPFDLAEAQYFARSWDVTAASGATNVTLSSAFPFRGSPSTATAGIDAQAVWLGLGTQADFAGRDVRGKVAVVYSQPLQSSHDHSAREFAALERARDAGAVAILMVLGVPGNMQHVMYLRSEEKIPFFSVGQQDGMALLKLIEQQPDVRMRIRLNAEFVPGLKSASVWGTLPGTSNEEIMITAHRDGFFEGAGDNASGVAVMLGLAEYFAKIPQAQRRRTLRFMGAVGHHHIGPNDTARLNDNREAMSRLVLVLNPEHTGWTETYTYGLSNRKANGVTPLRWYLRGSDQLRSIMFNAYDTFGVKTLQQPGPGGAGDSGRLEGVPLVSVIQSPIFFHSNFDVPGNLPAANLEAVARAFAKIIDQVNKLNREDLTGTLHTETTESTWDHTRPQ